MIITIMTAKKDIVENNELGEEQSGIRCALPSTRRIPGHLKVNSGITEYGGANIATGRFDKNNDDVEANTWRTMRWARFTVGQIGSDIGTE